MFWRETLTSLEMSTEQKSEGQSWTSWTQRVVRAPAALSSYYMAESSSIMLSTLLRFLLVSSASTAAFQASNPCSSIKHRKGVGAWKYSQDEESSTQNVDGGASADVTNAAPHNNPEPKNVVVACMDAMLKNDVPWMNHGLEICFDFSSDRCRASLGGSLDEFISYAANPSFGPMINAKKYDIVNVGPMIAGSSTRGSMQTVLVKVSPEKGGDRHFLW